MASLPIPQIKFNPPVYVCRKTSDQHILDGNIDKPFWEKAEFTELFRDIEGDLRPSPKFDTRAKMLWDDNNLYIAAEIMGDEIWANMTERDCVIFNDNDFEIFIDPDGDTHEYVEFEMNAINTVWDLLLTKPYLQHGTAINCFDIAGLRTAVHVDGKVNTINSKNNKWSVEVVMPLASLNQVAGSNTPSDGKYWRVNYSRVQWHCEVVDDKYEKLLDKKTGRPLPEENWVWSPTGIINIHYPELWGFMFFSESEDTQYSIPEIEYTKWKMRIIYYYMYKFFDEKGHFTNNIEQLNIDDIITINPNISVTPTAFEIAYENIILYSDSKVVVK